MTIWIGLNENSGQEYDSNARFEPPWQLGLIPEIIRAEDTRGVVEQVNANYAHGGGWSPFHGIGVSKWRLNKETMNLQYPGDPTMHAQWKAAINPDETVFIYDSGWVLLLAASGTFEISRMD